MRACRYSINLSWNEELSRPTNAERSAFGGLVGERKYRIGVCLTERSVFIVSLVYIQIYKGISLRARRGKKESALSEAGETFHEVARQGR